MDPIAAFGRLLTPPERGEPRPALDRGAWCIAATARGDVHFDPDAPVTPLDDLAARCPATDFAELATWLFVTEGFTGNRDHYEDPANSYLPDVLERRLGLPITLTVVMMEVGRRGGVPVVGVGMPGHFLAGDPTTPDRFCDPFHAGALLDPAGCARRFASVQGSAAGFEAEMLRPVPDVSILDRMLANLQQRALHASRRDLVWITRLRLRMPDRPPLDAEALTALLVESGGFGVARSEYDRLLTDAEARGDTTAVARITRHRTAAQARTN